MPTKSFETIKGHLESFLGGIPVKLTPQIPEDNTSVTKGHSISINITLDNTEYFFFTDERPLPFTETELTFCKEFLTAYQVLYNGFREEKYATHFRTSLMISLMDISVARYLRRDRRKAFWPIQTLVQILKSLSYQRYEGVPATTGFVIYRKTLKDFRSIIKKSKKYSWANLETNKSVTSDFFKNPLPYRFIDGTGSVFAGNIRMNINGIIRVNPLGNKDTIERLANRNISTLLKNTADGSFAIYVNSYSEIEIFSDNNEILIWRRGYWSLFDPKIFNNFLIGLLDEKVIDDLVWTIYSLSKTKRGTIILICEKYSKELKSLKKGFVGDEDLFNVGLLNQMRKGTISQLKKDGELINILSSDGLTIFNRRGRLVETGFIIDTSQASKVVTGGGRTTAATAASNFGKVIKISEDGPVELYQNGECIYRFG